MYFVVIMNVTVLPKLETQSFAGPGGAAGLLHDFRMFAVEFLPVKTIEKTFLI